MEGRSRIGEAEQFLRTQLAAGPQPVSELVKRTDIKLRMLQLAAQRLGIHRTRDGEGGPWIWALDAVEYLSPPPANAPAPPAEDAEQPAQVFTSANACTVGEMLALAEQGGLHWPLIVTIRNPPPPAEVGKWSTRVFSAPGVIQRVISDDFTVDDDAAYGYITVHEQSPPPRVGTGVDRLFAPGPWSLVFRDGQLTWRDWRYRPPRPVVRKKSVN